MTITKLFVIFLDYNSPDLVSRACQILGIFSCRYRYQHLSLLRCLRGPRRQQILLPSQLTRSSVEAGSMYGSPSSGSCLASGPPFLLLAVRPLASCLPDSACGCFFPNAQRLLAMLTSDIDARTFQNLCFTIGKPTCP